MAHKAKLAKLKLLANRGNLMDLIGMKKMISTFTSFDYWQSRCHLIIVIVCLFLALLGQMPQSSSGWVLPIDHPLGLSCMKRPTKGDRRRRRRTKRRQAVSRRQRLFLLSHYLHQTWLIPTARALLLALCFWSFKPHLLYLSLVPFVLWFAQALSIYSPSWAALPEYVHAKPIAQKAEQAFILIAILVLSQQIALLCSEIVSHASVLLMVGLPSDYGLQMVDNQVILQANQNEDQEITHYSAVLKGEFHLQIPNDDPFRLRMLILFLRQLEVVDQKSIGRQTRDKRSPFVKQQLLAEAYGVAQPHISLWERYWLSADWRRLLSVRSAEILSLEVQDRVVSTFAQFPWWGNKRVHQHLNEQGLKVSHHQVKQAAHESGFNKLRQLLRQRFVIGANSFKPRDSYLVGQLLEKQAELIKQLETRGQLPEQLKIELADLNQMALEIGIKADSCKVQPWALRLEQLLFGDWERLQDGQVRCIYCNCDEVSRKSKKPRIKRYLDEFGQEQSCEVYRYYCRNKDCDKGTFTNLPVDLLPHSPYSLTRHLLALKIYGIAGNSYRRSGQALGVSSATVYRWVSGCGNRLLPIASLFGVVRCSGAIGIDEKFVLVPKNEKEAGKMRRWMYVYVAVDCYTYDLLHIAIYRYRNENSARTFLLELKAKGYRPKIVVSDLWSQYNQLFAEIFPKATHQECIFHGLQEVQKKIKKIYGNDYKKECPEAIKLKEEIYCIFKAKTKRTAYKRYNEVMGWEKVYVENKAESKAIFTFLEKHWPRLSPAIENQKIPRTNNTAELVIRRFDQHYQNFCGFDNYESAKQYLAVFEKLYRFTAFSQDAQLRLRGKSPLEVAGYDVSQMPMAAVCAGLSPQLSNKSADSQLDQDAKEAAEVALIAPISEPNLVPSL